MEQSNASPRAVIMEAVDFSYQKAHAPVLKSVTLEVEEAAFLGIIGPNAGGKSTLLKLILGLIKPDRGYIKVLGKSVSSARSQIGYVAQHPSFMRNFPITVFETVLMGRLDKKNWGIRYTQKDKHIALEAMQAVRIANIQDQPLSRISGGQLQRTLIARALAGQPRLLLLDEPTAHIDMRTEEDLFTLLKEYNANMTIIVVSHDIGFISCYVNQVACVNQTLVCHPTQEIDGEIIERLYNAPVRFIQHNHNTCHA